MSAIETTAMAIDWYGRLTPWYTLIPPAMTEVTLRCCGPKISRARFVNTIATAKVVMNVIISKSIAFRRFISGCTDTSCVNVPNRNVTANANTMARTGFQPATTRMPHPTKLPIMTMEPCDMSRIRRVP